MALTLLFETPFQNIKKIIFSSSVKRPIANGTTPAKNKEVIYPNGEAKLLSD